MYELLRHIQKSEASAQAIIEARVAEIKKQSSGFLGFLKSAFLIPENTNDEFTIEERKKVPNYLQIATRNLMDIFQICDVSCFIIL